MGLVQHVIKGFGYSEVMALRLVQPYAYLALYGLLHQCGSRFHPHSISMFGNSHLLDVVLLPCLVQIVASNDNELNLIKQELEPKVSHFDGEPLNQHILRNASKISKQNHMKVNDHYQAETRVTVDKTHPDKTELLLEIQRHNQRYQP